LTEEDVREIRAIKRRNDKRKTLQHYAEQYGVSRETIRKVFLKRTSGDATLTPEQGKSIKKNYRPAENYKKFLDAGVSKGAIASVLSGRTWRGVR
jgi:uridine kinase